jgi:hypothetical protein
MARIEYKNHLITDGKKHAVGYKQYKKMMKGNKLTALEAIQAFCFECLGGYADGIVDCQCYNCPLYDHHYYRNGKYLSKVSTEKIKTRDGIK